MMKQITHVHLAAVVLSTLLLGVPSALASEGVDVDATVRPGRAWDLVSPPGPLATFGASLLVGSLAIATQSLKRQ